MEFLQKRFYDSAKLKSPLVKKILCEDFQQVQKRNNASNKQGFVMVLFLPFLALMITGIIGLTTLSIGIKNITKTQSHCIIINFQAQKELGILLQKLLALNNKVRRLNEARKVIETSIAGAATSVILIPQIPKLKKARDFIKQAQKLVIARQKLLLAQSSLIKKKALIQLKKSLNKLKASHIREAQAHKKALAVDKEKIGDQAYIYKPVPDFINQQKIQWIWNLQSFFPLNQNLKWMSHAKTVSTYHCSATLKQKETQWISKLYH